MARRDRGSRWIGLLVGPILLVGALTALWKNETRFDYSQAAAGTTAITAPADTASGEVISLTGDMDQQLTYAGEYVESLTGYLTVSREAEIYAWKKSTDSNDNTTWELKWMNYPQSNHRNSGVRQQLSSSQFFPDEYRVGELTIDRKLIEFVDDSQTIEPSTLTLSATGRSRGLHQEENERKTNVPAGKHVRPAVGDEFFKSLNKTIASTPHVYFYLRKGKADALGDERVRYVGIPVPSPATYFGKLESARGVADQTHRRTGFINHVISDSGVLHHIVGGERDVALSTMQAHIGRLKWVVRGIGTGCVVFGWLLFCWAGVRFLLHIPFIGGIAATGSWLLALGMGLPLAICTIIAGYLVSHPLILIVIVALVVGAIVFVRNRGRSSQRTLKSELDIEHGHELGADELKELEFIELATLAQYDSRFSAGEEKFLQRFAKRNGWNKAKYDEMFERAQSSFTSATDRASSDKHLTNLVRLAMADGQMSSRELRAIRDVGKRLGYDRTGIRAIISGIQKGSRSQAP